MSKLTPKSSYMLSNIYICKKKSNIIMNKYINLFSSEINNYFISSCLKRLNNFLFEFSISILTENYCFNEDVFYSLSKFLSDYYLALDNLEIFKECYDKHHYIFYIFNLSIFLLSSLGSYFDLLFSLINSSLHKETFLITFISYFKNIFDIFFPTSVIQKPFIFTTPKTKVKYPKEHFLVNVLKIFLRRQGYDIPELHPKIVDIQTHLQRIDIGHFAKLFHIIKYIDFTTLIKYFLLKFSEYDLVDDDLRNIHVLLGESALSTEVLNLISLIKKNKNIDSYKNLNIDNLILSIKNLCSDEPISIIFKNLVQLLVSILIPSKLKKIKNFDYLLISMFIIILPLITLEFSCCPNCFHFAYLNLRFIIDNFYFFQMVRENLSCMSSEKERCIFIDNAYNYFSYIIKQLFIIHFHIILFWVTLRPRMPKLFIETCICYLKPILDTIPKNSVHYQIVKNLLDELNCMISKQYKSSTDNVCDYCSYNEIYNCS